jgi:hypothetical protein
VQHFEGNQVVRQDEDSDYDGTIDRSYAGTEAIELDGTTLRLEPFGALGCGTFDAFWKNH